MIYCCHCTFSFAQRHCCPPSLTTALLSAIAEPEAEADAQLVAYVLFSADQCCAAIFHKLTLHSECVLSAFSLLVGGIEGAH